MKHISLFSGISGDTLAAEWAGFETVLFVENDKFCQKVLTKHWPDVPIIGDIHDVTKETIANAQYNGRDKAQEQGEYPENQRKGTARENIRINESQGIGSSRKLTGGDDCPRWKDKTGSTPITLITGGFPCQPFSVAGKQRGKEDDRYLWPEMLRVIKEVRPVWVVAENVAGLLRMGIDDCISDLESEGYTTEPYIIPACAVNAPHRRDRVFIVGYSEHSRGGLGLSDNKEWQETNQGWQGFTQPQSCKGSQDVADTSQQGLQGRCSNAIRQEEGWFGNSRYTGKGNSSTRGTDQWAVEPDVGRVAHGIPSRVDRLKALGNAIVPQQIYPILKAIADIEL